jgi:hypothetical protein
MELETAMKDFSNASFSPDLIAAMDQALQSAVATLPDPVSSVRVQEYRGEHSSRCAAGRTRSRDVADDGPGGNAASVG